ncbi:MAG: type VI secretion system tube protein Hcp [Planctomycetota bacterium]
MAIAIHIPGIQGDCKLDGFKKKGSRSYFVAESFSFGIEREMKESAEKGGTEDINIGVGELQECSISKSMDSASADLAQAAIQGNNLGDAEIYFIEIAGEKKGLDTGVRVYLAYKLHRCMVKTWSTSGDADDRPTEEVSFLFNKIAFAYAAHDGTNWVSEGNRYMGWDNVENCKWDQKQAALKVGSAWKPS